MRFEDFCRENAVADTPTTRKLWTAAQEAMRARAAATAEATNDCCECFDKTCCKGELCATAKAIRALPIE